MKQYNIHYLTVEDVMDITGYKIGKSYKIMRELNKELKKSKTLWHTMAKLIKDTSLKD